MSKQSSQCDELRRLAGIARGYAEVNTRKNGRALLFESAEAMREAADTIESLRERLKDADVAYNDTEVLGDVTQGLFRDLMAADPDTAKLWARSWPELFGEGEVDA